MKSVPFPFLVPFNLLDLPIQLNVILLSNILVLSLSIFQFLTELFETPLEPCKSFLEFNYGLPDFADSFLMVIVLPGLPH